VSIVNPAPGRRDWRPRFALLAVIWGLSFLFVKIGEQAFAPLPTTCGRMFAGTLTLGVALVVRRGSLPQGRRVWFHLAVAALLLNVLPFSLIAYGERHVSSIAAGIWNATTPLFTLPVAVALIADERLTARRAAGLLVGFAGVLTVFGIWRGVGAGSATGNLLCLCAAASYGLGFPYARRFLAGRSEPPVSLAAGQLLCGSAELALLAPVLAGAPPAVALGPLAAVLALGALGTGLAYILNYSIIRDAGATTASTVAYVMPVVATVAGVTLLGESLAWYQPVGAALVLSGAALMQSRSDYRRTAEPVVSSWTRRTLAARRAGLTIPGVSSRH
jgi:drug/metabolite transporter (DMT)-like permease